MLKFSYILLGYSVLIFLVMATMYMKPSVGFAREDDIKKTEEIITEVISSVKKALGFDKIQTMRFESELRGENTHWETTVTFKRPSYIKKETRVYEKGELVSKYLEITDGVNLQNVRFDAYDIPVKFYPMIPLKARKRYQYDTHPLFEFIELNPKFYSEIKKGDFNGTKVYILRSEKIKGLSLECWITDPSHRMVKILVSDVANNPFFQVTDFKYIEIGQGIWYPTSYVIEHLKEKVPPTRVSASNFEVNIGIPNETFMFLPEKAETNNRNGAE